MKRRIGADESRAWVMPYLTEAGVRRDVATFARGWSPPTSTMSPRVCPASTKPVLLCWAPADRFFRIELGRRLAATFPNARLVEFADARTFVSLDQPERLAKEIAGFAAVGVRLVSRSCLESTPSSSTGVARSPDGTTSTSTPSR